MEEERVCWLGWSKRLATRSGRRVFALCEVDEEATPTAVDCVCTFVFKIRFGSLLNDVAMNSVGASVTSHRLVSSAT